MLMADLLEQDISDVGVLLERPMDGAGQLLEVLFLTGHWTQNIPWKVPIIKA